VNRRAALVWNPAAGRGYDARIVERLAGALAPAFAVEVLPTATPEAGRAAARRAVDAGLDALFVLGGDGSLNNAARELLGSGTALGPLPGGTTNVVASALGLPADPVAAARALTAAGARELDVGRAGAEGVFLMQVSGGLDARVMAAVDARWKRRLGKLAVAWTGLREWARYRFPRFALEVDGERTEATGFVVANLSEYAGRFAIVPGARADDRRLDLLLFRGTTRRSALAFALDLARGRHAARDDVEIRRIERVHVAGPARLELQGDGDPFVTAPPLELRLSTRRLRVLVPPAGAAAPGGAAR
jgi:diacylglycerol kinase (ATP)